MKRFFNTIYLKALFLISCTAMQGLTLQAQDINVNQTGFLPSSTKLAQVPNGSGSFQVVNTNTNAVVFNGTLSSSINWQEAQESFATADFSAVETAGTYKIVAGGNESHPFEIGQSVYDGVASASLKFYYYQRSSTSITSEHGGTWARGFGHPDTNVKVHSSAGGGRAVGSTFSAPKGWYDAGDYGKYVVNSGISTWTLMAFYEMYPEFSADFDVNIPESGNNMPDILDEAKWNLDWLLQMQDPSDGGVYHKMTTLGFEGEVMPSAAHQQRYVIGKATAATFDFAALMAQAARVYAPYDAAYAQQCLTAAERAWNWGANNDNITFDNPGDVHTGTYGDNNLSDEKAWAAIELYITTGQDSYWNASNLLNHGMRVPGWPDVAPLGYLSLIANKDNLTSAANIAEVESRVINYANMKIGEFNSSPYKVVETSFNWGNNANFLNDGMIALYGYELTGNSDHLSVAQSSLDYILGKNPTGMSYFTGFGENRPMHPHHRPSQADGIFEPVPGMVVGGAQNASLPGGECFHPNSNIPAKRYFDDWCSYSTNEVTINWNAPMVFVANGILAIGNTDCENPAVVDVLINGESSITIELDESITLSARALNECGGTVRDAVFNWSSNAPNGVFSNTSTLTTEIVTLTVDGISTQVTITVVPENATLVADAENNGITKLNTEWFALDDNGNGGASTITPNATPLPMTSGGAVSTSNSVEVSYVLNEGTLEFNPFVGFGFPLSEEGTGREDIASSTGISFWHKGDAMIVKVPTTSITDFDYYASPVPAHADWTMVELSWNQFSQAGWGDAVSFNATDVTSIQYEVQGPTGTAGTVAVDEIKIEGIVLTLICETPEVATVEISEGDQSIVIDQTFNFTAIVKNGCGQLMQDELITWSANAPNGVYTATTLGASDQVTATAGNVTAVINITVTPNQSPVANAGNNVSTSLINGTAQLTGSGTDPEEDALSYNWIQVDGPSTATILNPTSAITVINDLVLGTYVFELTVTDAVGNTSTDQVNVEVKDVINMLSNGDFSNGFEGWTTYINASATANHDVVDNQLHAVISNGGSDTWHVQYNQGGLEIENGAEYRISFDARSSNNRSIVLSIEKNGEPWTGFFSAQPSLNNRTQQFSYEFTMEEATETNGRVTFNVGNSNIDVFIDNVVLEKLPKANEAPIANAGDNQVLQNGTSVTTLDGSVSNDPDNGPVALTYAWTQTVGPAVTFDNVSVAQPTVSGLQDDTNYEFSLVVSDGEASSSSTVSVSLQGKFTLRIEAEEFSTMSGIQVEPTEDVDGVNNIGWVDSGDFMEYNVNIPGGGEGKLRFRIAADGFDNKSFTVSANGSTLADVNFQATGGWQNWKTISVDATLPSGQTTIRVQASSDGFNMNWLEITNEEGDDDNNDACTTWEPNTNYPVGTVVSYNGNNYTSNNEWNGTAGAPDIAIWGWNAGGSCSSNGRSAAIENTTTLQLEEELSLYPNPAQHEIILSGLGEGQFQVAIYSISGKLENFLSINNAQGSKKLAIDNLKSGLYVIQISGNNFTKSLKFLKK
ncbi:carbohydrate-binding protein [Flammeovirga pectinis]|uniref:Endoglucanase n=1 Tax=Flammeovirga pectinis TaxID=2494373 RepID=A0A3Q9FR52_9BACT|nr:glycoside hydrolase family 9 protein [Flammeovirga pectinis]AZQ64068.1 carbohydrate-binding protein [Flammeovirga pectinis]